MSFLTISQNRYTTKKYDPTKKIADKDIEELKEILRLSPSSINSQPWKFIFVADKEIKSQFAKASFYNEQKIEEASHLIVFCAIDDVLLFEAQIKKNLPEGASEYFKQSKRTLPEVEIKSWFRNQVYLSLGYFLSACASMKIDSTPMEGIDANKYNQILNLSGYRALFAVAIGYRDVSDTNQPTVKPKLRLAIDEVVTTL